MRGYFIRITPLDDAEVGLHGMVAIIENELGCEKYVVSREVASRVHFHALIYTAFSPERVRYRLKGILECQLYISGKDIQDKVSCIAYTIKDGSYVQKGIDVCTWLQAKQKTHKKVTFDDVLKTISNKYRTSGNDDQLLEDIRQLYIDFHRRMYKHHIRGLYDTIKITHDSRYWKQVKNEIMGLW